MFYRVLNPHNQQKWDGWVSEEEEKLISLCRMGGKYPVWHLPRCFWHGCGFLPWESSEFPHSHGSICLLAHCQWVRASLVRHTA